MQIQIRDYSGCQAADLTLQTAKITLVAGRNRAAKSSTLAACAALLSGRLMPNGKPKTEAGGNIRIGAAEAVARMTDETGETSQITWSPVGVEQEGHYPSISGTSAGLDKFSSLPLDKRSLFLTKLLGALPSEAETAQAVQKVTGWALDDKRFTDLWRSISVLGWDAAQKEAEESQRQKKSKWCALANAKAWAGTGLQWKPSDWSLDLQNADIKLLRDAVTASEQQYETALKAEAVSDADRQRLTKLASEEPALKKGLEDIEQEVQQLGIQLMNTRKVLENNPPPGKLPESQACPCCQKPLVVMSGKIISLDAAFPADSTAQQAAHDKWAAEVGVIAQQLSIAEKTLNQTRSSHREALAAVGHLKLMAKPVAKSDKTAAEYKLMAQTAKTRLQAFEIKQSADHAWSLADQQIKLTELLKPEGLRQQALVDGLANLNATILGPLCNAAHWGHVMIGQDMGIHFGGIDYFHASESEKYRTNVILQVAFAQLNNDPIVIIDGADILDAPARAELFGLLAKQRIGAIVGMTAAKMTDVPNLEDKKAGFTFWMEAGVSHQLSAVPY